MRIVQAQVPVSAVNAAAVSLQNVDLDASQLGLGFIPDAMKPYITAVEKGDPSGVFHQTTLTLTNLPQTIVNGASEWVGTEIFDFPLGRINVQGVASSLAPTTTSTLASTITTGTTGAVSLGTVTDDGTHSTTKVDLGADTAYTSSTTINVAAAAVKVLLAAEAKFDGSATAKKMFLNNKIATNTNDGTMTWSGTITINWANLGPN